jgi:hypothetical protein
MSSENMWTITLPDGVKLRRGMEIESVDFIAKTATVGEGPDYRESFRWRWLTVDAMPDHKVCVADRAITDFSDEECYLQTFSDPDPGGGTWVVAKRLKP